MIEPRMATMLGVSDDGREGRRRPCSPRRCGASSTRRSTRSRSTASARRTTACSRWRPAHRASTITRDDDPALLEALARRRRPSGARDRARRRGRDQARHRARHRRGDAGRRVAGGADDRELAARQDGDSWRRSELGPPHRGGRPIGRGVRARSRVGRRSAPCRSSSNGVPHDERAADAADRARRQRTSRSPSTSAPADRTTATMWTCDFSAEYVRINAEYRT